MSPVLLCSHQLILGLKLTVQNHNPTLYKLTNPSEEAKGFKGPLSVLLKLFRLCQVGVSFRTTESDLDHSLKLGLKFYEKIVWVTVVLFYVIGAADLLVVSVSCVFWAL